MKPIDIQIGFVGFLPPKSIQKQISNIVSNCPVEISIFGGYAFNISRGIIRKPKIKNGAFVIESADFLSKKYYYSFANSKYYKITTEGI